jgi:hypothetical protein
MRATLRFAFLLATTAAMITPASAWDGFGHMEVAAVAWAQMSDPAKTRSIELLKHNPQYKTWIKGVAANDRDRIAFMMAATWPDFIKRQKGYKNDGADNGDVPPPGPKASQNIGYKDKLRHKYWHFIDTTLSPENPNFKKDPPAPNVKTQIATFRKVLPSSSGADDDVRSYDLVWLIHLVGDAHQPLHAAARFSKAFPNGDAGGNLVKIDCESAVSCESASELHAFWDNILGPNETTPQRVAAAAEQLPQADSAKASITDESIWLEESFELAKSVAYESPPIRDDGETSTITEDYRASALKVAKQQIALAGARLAKMLDESFR